MTDSKITPREPAEAIEQLRNHQQQIDEDGTFVGVSRQALDEVLAYLDAAPSPDPSLSDRETPEIERLRPYKVFSSPSSTPDWPDFFMVSTLTLPQHPVALCGPNQAFADEICDLLNGRARTSPAPVVGGGAACIAEGLRTAAEIAREIGRTRNGVTYQGYAGEIADAILAAVSAEKGEG